MSSNHINHSSTISFSSIASDATNSSLNKQADENQIHHQNQNQIQIPKRPGSQQKPAPSQLPSQALDLKRSSVGSFHATPPPTPPPTHPIPAIPSPTTSLLSDDNIEARIRGTSEVRNGQNPGLGLSSNGQYPQEGISQNFKNQSSSEEGGSFNGTSRIIRPKIINQSRSRPDAKSVTSEASTDTFGIFSKEEAPPPLPQPLPINLLNSKNLEAVSSNRILNHPEISKSRNHRSQIQRGNEASELVLEDEDEDEEDYDYSDDETTEQAHHDAGSAATSSSLGNTLNIKGSLSLRDNRSPRNGGFPLPPPRVESLDEPKKSSVDQRKVGRTTSFGKSIDSSNPQNLTLQARLKTDSFPPNGSLNRRTLGSLSSSQKTQTQNQNQNQAQSQILSRNPSRFATHKTSATSSLTEMPERDFNGYENRFGERDFNGEEEEEVGNEKSFYKRSIQRSNLSEWAPIANPSQSHFGIANLPDWDSLRAGEPTSKPISLVKRDMDWSLRRLISQQVFEQLLADDLGRYRFREYLVRSQGTQAKLDMLFDLMQYSKTISALKINAEAIHDIYLVGDSPNHQNLPLELDNQVFGSLKKTFELRTSMEDTQNHLLQSLYKNEFQNFIKNQIIEQTKVKLGESNDPNDLDGLGNCYCLTNPRLRENPIVLISDGFTSVTGYSRQSIIGRNCRFLQGPGTASQSIQRVRDALNKGEAITELLLNYRKDGTPFFCLLNIIPLREASGKLAYFIGGQTNVTGTLASSKGLSFLLSGDNQDLNNDADMPKNSTGQEISFTMAKHLGVPHGAGMANLETSSVFSGGSSVINVSRPDRGRAAGAYDPDADPISGLIDSSNKIQGKKNGFFKMFGSKSGPTSPMMNNKKQPNSTGNHNNNQMMMGQRLEGAESKDLRNREANTLEEQMKHFTNQSGKLLILRRLKREIIFVTEELLEFFDLPIETSSQSLNSPLIHADFLSLLCGNDKNETKDLRSIVSKAISKGEALNIEVGIRQPSKKRLLGTNSNSNDGIIKYTTLFLTPLKDSQNASYALVALFA